MLVDPPHNTDSGALAAHLLGHLAYSADSLKTVERLGATLPPVPAGTTMAEAQRFLGEEQLMLRALLHTLGTSSRSVTRAAAPSPELSTDGDGPATARDPGSWLQPSTAFDAVLVGCWGRRALWRELARHASDPVRVELDTLVSRSESIIDRLEALQLETTAHR